MSFKSSNYKFVIFVRPNKFNKNNATILLGRNRMYCSFCYESKSNGEQTFDHFVQAPVLNRVIKTKFNLHLHFCISPSSHLIQLLISCCSPPLELIFDQFQFSQFLLGYLPYPSLKKFSQLLLDYLPYPSLLQFYLFGSSLLSPLFLTRLFQLELFECQLYLKPVMLSFILSFKYLIKSQNKEFKITKQYNKQYQNKIKCMFNQRMIKHRSHLTNPQFHAHQQIRHNQSGQVLILFILSCFCISMILRFLNRQVKIPYSPMLLILGIIIGYFRNALGAAGICAHVLEKLDPQVIILVFIPTIVFESAFNCSWYIFRKLITHILVLAGPGTLTTAILIACSFKLILKYEDSDLTWSQGLTLGSILSATDPVAVVALLKQLGASKNLRTLIEGESMLNDRVAMVLFSLFINIVKEKSFSSAIVSLNIIKSSLGGPLFGIIFAILICFLLKRIKDDSIAAISISILGVYLCFYITQLTPVKVSGIISTVSLGLYLSNKSKQKFSFSVQQNLHKFWAFLQFNCQTFILIITGLVIEIQMIGEPTITRHDWFNMFLLWLLSHIIRGFTVLIFYPIFKSQNNLITNKQLVFLVYGGLRGAIGICLALLVAVDDQLSVRFRHLVIFYMCGMVILTILVNGLTSQFVVYYLQIIKTAQTEELFLLKNIQYLKKNTLTEINDFSKQQFLVSANWKRIKQKFEQQQKRLLVELNKQDTQQEQRIIEYLPNLRIKFTLSLQKYLLQMKNNDLITEYSIKILNSMCQQILSNPQRNLDYHAIVKDNFNLDNPIRFQDIPIFGAALRTFNITDTSHVFNAYFGLLFACKDILSLFEGSYMRQIRQFKALKEEVLQNMDIMEREIGELQLRFPVKYKNAITNIAYSLLKQKEKDNLHKLQLLFVVGPTKELLQLIQTQELGNLLCQEEGNIIDHIEVTSL